MTFEQTFVNFVKSYSKTGIIVNAKESEIIQNICFKNGWLWAGGGDTVRHLYATVLYFTNTSGNKYWITGNLTDDYYRPSDVIMFPKENLKVMLDWNTETTEAVINLIQTD